MDKNSVTGLILIAVILFGFTFFQSKQARKAAALQAQQDSIALAQRIAAVDTVVSTVPVNPGQDALVTAGQGAADATGEGKESIYKDPSLRSASTRESSSAPATSTSRSPRRPTPP